MSIFKIAKDFMKNMLKICTCEHDGLKCIFKSLNFVSIIFKSFKEKNLGIFSVLLIEDKWMTF